MDSVDIDMSGVQQLKVDITTLDLSDPKYCTLVLNFNVPASIVENNVPHTYNQVLENIAQFIEQHFNTTSVIFQVTASYYLVHSQTADSRLWTGSFNPANNQSSTLSGNIFESYQSAQYFIQTIEQSSVPQHITNCLQWDSEDSDWNFDSLASIIICVQIKIVPTHDFITNNGLDVNRNGRGRQRSILTKIYPF